MDDIILIDELAAALGIAPATLRRSWARRHARNGFPRKLPGCWGWPRAAVEAWVRAGGHAAPAAANENSECPALAARYGGRP